MFLSNMFKATIIKHFLEINLLVALKSIQCSVLCLHCALPRLVNYKQECYKTSTKQRRKLTALCMCVNLSLNFKDTLIINLITGV